MKEENVLDHLVVAQARKAAGAAVTRANRATRHLPAKLVGGKVQHPR